MTKAKQCLAPEAEPDDTAIDMSSLDTTVGFMLKRAQIAVSREIHAIFADFEVTAVQFSVLSAVSDNPGMAQAELAAALEVERPRMVPVLDKLVARGLAERRQDSRDGRTRRIYVTKAGERLLTELRDRFAQLEARIDARLTTTLGPHAREQLLQALRCVADKT